MKWESGNLELFYQSKEYIDTLCIPLIPIKLDSASTDSKLANQKQSMQILVNELERNFTGRLLLSPIYTYLYETNYESEAERLEQWTSHLARDNFKHVFLLTNDVNWKKQESHLSGNLVWLTAPMTDDIRSDKMKEFIKDQTTQVSELIKSYW